MSHVPHELAEEFPNHVRVMHTLKISDAHFAKLFEAYHDLNRAIHRAETNVEPTDDAHMSDLRRQRMQLKDELFGILNAAH
ncbi:MAG: YdcH family protein [Pseudomonadota bacterium]